MRFATRIRRFRPPLPPVRVVLGWALLLILLTIGGLQIFRPDPRDALRAADQLLAAGRYHEALAAYGPLAPALPEAQLRLGLVRALRGERVAGERALRLAMQRGLAPGDYHLALIYLGQLLANDGRAALALRTWALLEDCRSPAACAYRAPGRLLVAESALRRGDYPVAEAGYIAALSEPLPPGWAGLANYRLALLRAPRDPASALATLATRLPTGASTAPLLAPLLAPLGAQPDQLAAVLAEPDATRPQLLGQIYLSLDLYGLAEDQFARVDPQGPEALSAAAYAAYARLRAGDAADGTARLEALVEQHPDEPRARTLLALAYLSAQAGEAARDQIDAVAQLVPGDPDVHLAWASWYAARHEYAEAGLEYGRALAQAPQPERGRYALLGARFHLATTYELCESGLPLAELAAEYGPTDAGTLSVLAAGRYHCGQYTGAAEAARAARVAGAGPDAAYYLGAALAALGESSEARTELIRAADLAPASIWRQRAELALSYLP